MRKIIFLILLASCLVSCIGKKELGETFIKVENGYFTKNGIPYYYIGTNYWYGAILGSTGRGGDRERLVRELDLMKENGVDNLRILVGADGEEGIPFRVMPTLQKEAGIYNDTIFEGLDFLLSEMGKRDMYAVLYLNNSWEWSGGYSKYLNWTGYGKEPIPGIDGWDAFNKYVAQYAECEECHSLFLNHIRTVVSRTNRYTNKKYTDDPAIMAWQVGNEPRAFSSEGKTAFAKWLSKATRLIRTLDSNHLITIGSEGKMGCENDMALFEEIHHDENVDYLTMHIWPKNWRWINADSIPQNVGRAISLTTQYMAEHIIVARQLNKPIVLEEFGLPRDNHKYHRTDPTTARDRYYSAIFDKIYQSLKQRDVLAGCNFWAWGGTGQPQHEFWQPWDDYVGDPGQEEQGLNSVFDTDTAMRIIKRYNSLLDKAGTNNISIKSKETNNLLDNLKKVSLRGFMFGHHDDTVYGIGWEGDEGESDVKRVCGDYPAVISFDLGELELDSTVNLDKVPFDKIEKEIINQYYRGEMISLSWHARNPMTGGDAWDIKDSTVVKSILPGGINHQKFVGWLDKVSAFISSLQTADNVKVPILFRPWHENTGSWFWWGEQLCTPDEYKALWEMTVNHFRLNGVNNILYAYSPGTEPKDTAQYLERYPGDEMVDVIGLDTYQFNRNIFLSKLDKSLAILDSIGKTHDKVYAVTEIGYEGIPDAKWWTGTLLPALTQYSLAYALVWRNARERVTHFYAPYPGQVSATDFVEFYKHPKTLFAEEVNLYQ